MRTVCGALTLKTAVSVCMRVPFALPAGPNSLAPSHGNKCLRSRLTLKTAVSVKNLLASVEAAIAMPMPERSLRASIAARYSDTCHLLYTVYL